MKMNDAFPSKWLKAADLNGREETYTISRYAMEKLEDEQKLILYFQGREKAMVCNKTNADRIAFYFGDDLDNWIGKSIILGSELVTFNGKTSEAIRVKGKSSPIETAGQTTPPVKPEAPFDGEHDPFA